MKIFLICIVALLIVIGESCKKTYPSTDGENPANQRKIRFQLYTDKDLSNETAVIEFSLFIRDKRTTLFDSSLASMQIKDIPDAAHKLVFEKTLSGNDNSDLAAGFNYKIQNVGMSWYIDTSKAGNVFKVIDYSFR
jgi:hypothetical protein